MAPYGYRTDGRGHLVIDETEAGVVRSMSGMRAEGRTLKEIADRLNAEGVPTRRNGRWHPATVRYMRDNPKYRGDVEYLVRWQEDGTRVIQQGQHEAIV